MAEGRPDVADSIAAAATAVLVGSWPSSGARLGCGIVAGTGMESEAGLGCSVSGACK